MRVLETLMVQLITNYTAKSTVEQEVNKVKQIPFPLFVLIFI